MHKRYGAVHYAHCPCGVVKDLLALVTKGPHKRADLFLPPAFEARSYPPVVPIGAIIAVTQVHDTACDGTIHFGAAKVPHQYMLEATREKEIQVPRERRGGYTASVDHLRIVKATRLAGGTRKKGTYTQACRAESEGRERHTLAGSNTDSSIRTIRTNR